ncbi:MAG TPA: glycosyl hydrolase-related protein, partial [bacterium]
LKRPVSKPDYSLFREIPQTEHPMNSFVDMSDGNAGLALLNEGLKAYETHDDAENTVSLTLIRAFPLRICVTSEMLDYSQQDKGSQCQGWNTFKYAIMPHIGDWIEGGLWKASEQFNLMQHAAQVGPTEHGFLPKIRSFLELDPEEVHVSAIKKSEDGAGWIVRLFNPLNKTVAGKLRLNEGFSGPQKVPSPVERIQAAFALPREKGKRWSHVRSITLEEVAENELVLDENGWVSFEITPKKIYTIEFMP